MVETIKGILLTCDTAVKEILVWLDEQGEHRFIIDNLDEDHLLVNESDMPFIEQELQSELERNQFMLSQLDS